MLFLALKAVAFCNASGIAFSDGGLSEEHIRTADLAFGLNEFGHCINIFLAAYTVNAERGI